MITHLSIRGLAIIDSLQIDFEPGFNVLTGETGAGKSILIRALSLLLGGKASNDMLRSGVTTAQVSGEFRVNEHHEALFALGNLGIAFEVSEGRAVLLLRRTLSASGGRAGCWINDTSVTLQSLREVGKTLVDIFGQHENQRLLDSSKHLLYVDQFLKSGEPKRQYEFHSRAVHDHLARLSEMLNTARTKGKDEDYLSFRYQELLEFEPSVEDFESIKALCEGSKKQVAEKDRLTRALSALEGEQGASLDSIREASKILTAFSEEEEYEKWGIRLHSVMTELEDVSFELSKRLESCEVDEEALEAARTRLFSYQDLFRKHGVQEVALLVEESLKMGKDLEILRDLSGKITGEISSLSKAVEDLKKAGEELIQVRHKAFSTIQKAVERELSELAMAGARFGVDWKENRRPLPALDFAVAGEKIERDWKSLSERLALLGTSGPEKPEFLLSSNKGEAMLSLSRVASGGELSRIMLALKKALVADAETCVLVFDEIDSGISGRVADTVGAKMRELSHSFQVLCISHLPQVAVYADRHYLVEKGKKGERTETHIVALSEEESAAEIARLLSGAKVTEASLKNAKHLISQAHAGVPRKKRKSIAKPLQASK